MGEKSIDNHHPLCLHLSLIYGPAEKPCCPQLLGSQLLFARISSPLLPTQPPQQTASYNLQGCRGSWRVWWLVPAMARPMVGCGKAQVGLSEDLGWQQGCGHHNEQHGRKAVRWTARKSNQKITFCPERLKIQLYLTRNQKAEHKKISFLALLKTFPARFCSFGRF